MSIDTNDPPKFFVILNSEKLNFVSLVWFLYISFIQFGFVLIENSSKKNNDKYLFSNKKYSLSNNCIKFVANSIFFLFYKNKYI